MFRYTPEQQEALVSNVFLTGGNMQYPGMKERVERELLAIRPFQSHFKVLLFFNFFFYPKLMMRLALCVCFQGY